MRHCSFNYSVKDNTPSCPIHSNFPLRQSQITKGYKFVVGFFISTMLLPSSHSFQEQVSMAFHVLFRPNDLFGLELKKSASLAWISHIFSFLLSGSILRQSSWRQEWVRMLSIHQQDSNPQNNWTVSHWLVLRLIDSSKLAYVSSETMTSGGISMLHRLYGQNRDWRVLYILVA